MLRNKAYFLHFLTPQDSAQKMFGQATSQILNFLLHLKQKIWRGRSRLEVEDGGQGFLCPQPLISTSNLDLHLHTCVWDEVRKSILGLLLDQILPKHFWAEAWGVKLGFVNVPKVWNVYIFRHFPIYLT